VLRRDAMMTDPLKRIPVLYHFTDRRNLDLIGELGGLQPLAELKRKGRRDTGARWERMEP
jgi:hypothetical protein